MKLKKMSIFVDTVDKLDVVLPLSRHLVMVSEQPLVQSLIAHYFENLVSSQLKIAKFAQIDQ